MLINYSCSSSFSSAKSNMTAKATVRFSLFLVLLLSITWLSDASLPIQKYHHHDSGRWERDAIHLSSTVRNGSILGIPRGGGGVVFRKNRWDKKPMDPLVHAVQERSPGRGGETSNIDKTDTWSFSEFQAKDLIYLTIHVAWMAGVVVYCRTFTRTGGRAPTWITDWIADPYATGMMHAIFFLLGLLLPSWILPEGLQRIIFSPPSVAILGSVFPAIESVSAAVTEGGTDDRTWLMYWVIHGIFQYSTEFMDQLALKSKLVYKYWHTFEVIAILWLLLPLTDGATLIYKTIAQPYLVPLVLPIKEFCDGWIATLAITTINASYIWWFSFIFMSLPVFVKRYAFMGVGTVFPLAATIMALTTTKDIGKETMRWLTYWPCFSLLFLIMIGIEKFVGSFKGLYVACLASALYLMLPMFDGSTLIFREVLIPLLGQRELLLLRDARTLAAEFIKKLPLDRQEVARQTAASAFTS